MTAWIARARGLLSTGVMLLLWVLVVTPLALLSRLVRGDVLGAPDPHVSSYWQAPEDLDEDGLIAFFSRRGKLWMVPVLVLLLLLGVLLVASESSLVVAFLYPLF